MDIVNVLAFDTCFAAVSASVRWRGGDGDWLSRDLYEPMTIGHAERLLPMIDSVMAGAGLGFLQIDRIAVTIGPGGFTGLRVGIAVARALSLATGAPVVGLSSLAVMAERANLLLGARRAGRTLGVVVDARRGANYVQMFGDNADDPSAGPQLMTSREAAAALPAGAVLLVGSGGPSVVQAAERSDVEAHLPDLQPHARQLALLAHCLPVLDPVTPMYLRDADAKPSAAPPLPRRTGL